MHEQHCQGDGDHVPRKVRVIFFGICWAGTTTNGGSLYARALLSQLHADAGLQMRAVVASTTDHLEGNSCFLTQNGIDHHIIEVHQAGSRRRKGIGRLPRRWGIPFEGLARNNPHIDDHVWKQCQEFRADILVVPYLPAVQFCRRTFERNPIKTCVITVNREAEMVRDLVRLGQASRISYLRTKYFEHSVHRSADIIVSIGRFDGPKSGKKATWIAPTLGIRDQRWAGDASNDLFFIGNYDYYPNRLAIDWLTLKLSPALAAIAPEVRIKIMGAQRQVVNAPPNVEFLGFGDEETKEFHFRNCAMFIAPIENTYGSKFKVLEAISYGMPVFGTVGALSGIPFLDDLPRFTLQNPASAAAHIARMMKAREDLSTQSRYISTRLHEYELQQSQRWSSSFRDLLENPQ